MLGLHLHHTVRTYPEHQVRPGPLLANTAVENGDLAHAKHRYFLCRRLIKHLDLQMAVSAHAKVQLVSRGSGRRRRAER